MAAQIQQFMCRSDNFGVLLHEPGSGATASIDAPVGDAVLGQLEKHGWRLTHILVTHHHGDHVEGIPALKNRYPEARITAPEKDRGRITGADSYLREGDSVEIGSLRARVIETPGHTAGHVVYWFGDPGLLFAGDTLFALGCGRVMETPMATMWQSLQKLMKLPPETQIYCGHEYTLANAKFALTVDPRNQRLRERAAQIEAARAAGKMTLPTSLEAELATNPFLRAGEPDVQAAVGMEGGDPAAVFGEVRKRKDKF